MGSQFLPIFTSIRVPLSLSSPVANPNSSFTNLHIWSSFPLSRPCAGPRLNSDAELIPSGRIRFNLDDDFYTDDDGDGDDEFEFRFRNNGKQRIWWSDDDLEIDDDDDDDEFWIFKLFRSFGWMLPAAIISTLLGTGPNAFLMALAVPLGQFVVSFAIDNVWGRKSYKPKPRPKKNTKKKPFAKAPSNTRNSEEPRQANYKTTMGNEKVHSWSAAVDNGDKRTQKFGGWDELDKRAGKRAPNETANGLPKQQKRGKLSRRRKGSDTPLLLRLLIAVFPILGSWTRFLF